MERGPRGGMSATTFETCLGRSVGVRVGVRVGVGVGVHFMISLKERLSTRSEKASMSTAWSGGGFCKNYCSLQAMRTRSSLAVVKV